MHDDFGKLRKTGLETIPDPDCQTLARGVLKPFDLVQVAMVDLIEDRAKCGFDVGKVHDPPGMFTEFAGDVDFDAEGVTVQSRTLVPVRHIRQPVRRFDRENLEDVHSTILLRRVTTRSFLSAYVARPLSGKPPTLRKAPVVCGKVLRE